MHFRSSEWSIDGKSISRARKHDDETLVSASKLALQLRPDKDAAAAAHALLVLDGRGFARIDLNPCDIVWAHPRVEIVCYKSDHADATENAVSHLTRHRETVDVDRRLARSS